MMKIKCLILGLILASICLGGCNDELSLVGPTIQPDSDKITVFTDTFNFEASTVLMNAVYARTDTSLLGEFYDPLYGTLKSDYICQFYCPDNFAFTYTPIDGMIDSVEFRIYYNAWIGDSLAPMRAQVYLVDKPLDKYYYTDMNPADYCDMQTLLGSQTYTARDMSVSDSLWATISAGGYTPNVRIRMPKEFGQKFYNETVNNRATFASQEAFNTFFPGLYVTNTFGTGSVLNVTKSYMSIYYKYIMEGSKGQDSVVYTQESFSSTKEVIQLNRFLNSDIDKLVQPNENYTYLKTPAGVCTRLVLPVKEIAPVVKDRILNNLTLRIQAMPQNDWRYALEPPQYLLLIPEDSVKTFFEKSQIPDNVSTYATTTPFWQTSPLYEFNNISNLLTYQLAKAPDKDLVMWLIPINLTQSYNSYYQTTFTTAVSNFLSPSGVTLRKDDDLRKLVVTSSRYN